MARSRRSRRLAPPMVVTAAAAMVVVGSTAWGLGDRIDEPAVVRQAAVRGPGQIGYDVDLFVPPRRALLLSDSAIAGLAITGATDRLTGTTWITDLEPCRRLVARSCPAPGGGPRPPTVVDELRALAMRPDQFDLLVIATGYNDLASRFTNDLATVVAEARRAGFAHVAWLTYRTAGSTALAPNYLVMNAILTDAVARGLPVAVWDYAAFTAPHDSWFRSDGVHLTATGSHEIAAWLSYQAGTFDVT